MLIVFYIKKILLNNILKKTCFKKGICIVFYKKEIYVTV
ncbi:hypothetical protein AsAng_0008250 [Aureispira anguillae]|uniref:Uncharacterized protein n=1 Tax=Aureispira anguillae TaxID=2864201 RepID=A0A915YBN8_9BACT|nr:hypothetical protein AsAng_0008250 [Aureispira anguillae]